MDTSRAAGPGLRERKKQQTREALSWAALRLAVERGLGNVLVEDIAAEAGVSPRTYNNYFSSKAEAITWRHLDRARRMADLLRARPPGEPLWESITCAAVAQAGGERASPEPEWIAGVRLMLSEPESAAADRYASILYFRVEDIDAAHRDLEQRGVSFVRPPHCVHRAPGVEVWMAFFHDPDRNVLALMQERRVSA